MDLKGASAKIKRDQWLRKGASTVQGYLDGYDLNAPEPSENRSHSYRHGFAVGRAEKTGGKLADFKTLATAADAAMAKDEAR